MKTIQPADTPSWLPRLAGSKGPRFLQIADALQAAVADGALTPGDRLPPQRELAAHLDVDLTTVTRAYDEARLRHRMARDMLAKRYSGLGDGLHVWPALPAYWNAAQFAEAAASAGIAVTPAEAFATGSASVNAIRISLGSIQARGCLQAGLQRLSQLLARRPEPMSAAIV